MKFAYNRDVQLEMNILDCITSEDDRIAAKENCDRALSGESHSNIRIYGDVELAFYESFFNPILNKKGESIGATGLARNITNRRRAEDELIKSEARFRSIINASQVPMALNDEGQHITYLNPAFVQSFGYTREDIPTLADWWPKAYPNPAYRQWAADSWQAELDLVKSTGTAFTPMELVVTCKNGSGKIPKK